MSDTGLTETEPLPNFAKTRKLPNHWHPILPAETCNEARQGVRTEGRSLYLTELLGPTDMDLGSGNHKHVAYL